jgi:hypothetical protein
MLFRANEVGAQSKKSRELAMVMRMNAARASMFARDSTPVLPLTFTLDRHTLSEEWSMKTLMSLLIIGIVSSGSSRAGLLLQQRVC